ncbi:MAG TPA: helix-turn-helix domain-containing protein [Thermoleophilaceae bacterium]|jgi:AraC-like DNA-binding protein/NAD(P)H-dependent FMN reductase
MTVQPRPSVLVVGGSRTVPSRTRALLEAVATAVEQAGALPELWDVRQAAQPGALRGAASRAQAFVVVTPTYHGSYSGLVKHALDQLDPAIVGGKPVALMATTGPVPTPQALDHLRIVAGALDAFAIPAQVVATEAGFERREGRYQIADELLRQRVRAVVQELVLVAWRLDAPGEPRLHPEPARNGGGAAAAAATVDLLRRPRGDYPDQIMRAIEYIRANFAKGPLPLDAVAREAHMSRYHFSRTFKRVTGVRFIEYVTRLRLAQACALLAESEQTITAVALAVGYQDLRPFERTFKKELGYTPSQYRRRVRAGLETPSPAGLGPESARGTPPEA